MPVGQGWILRRSVRGREDKWQCNSLCSLRKISDNSPAAGDADGSLGTSSAPAAPIALVTRFLRLDDTVTGGGATLSTPGTGIPGDECRRLAIVGLLEPTR
jgi:hypothetical protein